MTSDEKRDSDKQTAALGLEAALTAAIAHAQLAGLNDDFIDGLLALKQDALAAELRGSSTGSGALHVRHDRCVSPTGAARKRHDARPRTHS